MARHIGFIGLGAMGGPMVARLLDAGYEVTVHDVSQAAMDRAMAKGARSADSPVTLAEAVDTVLVCLPTPEIVNTVALGERGLVHGRRLKTYVDLSTTGPKVAEAVATAFAEKGVDALDSPVSGGIAGAVNGTLAVMAAGPHNVYGDIRPMLEVIGKNVFYCGEKAGQGQMMKLANNLVSAAAMAVTAEAVALGVKAGLDPKTMIQVLNAGSGRNSASQDKFPKSILPRTFDFGFKMGLCFKDVRLCLEAADQYQVPMLVGTAAREIWAYALQKGGPDEDFTNIMRHVEALADVEVPKRQWED